MLKYLCQVVLRRSQCLSASSAAPPAVSILLEAAVDKEVLFSLVLVVTHSILPHILAEEAAMANKAQG